MNQGSQRFYRRMMVRPGLHGFGVKVKETDLWIQAQTPLESLARELVLLHRSHLERYAENNPNFLVTLVPWLLHGPAPPIVRDMTEAGRLAGVGPMAAVAGAVAEAVGKGLLPFSKEVIVENGGDVFLQISGPITAAIYAGASPLSCKVGITVPCKPGSMGICTSSGSVGHSLSMGRADAVVVVSPSCGLADAVATAVGNRVHTPADIGAAIEQGRKIPGVLGLVVIMEDRMGSWGDLELVPLSVKKP